MTVAAGSDDHRLLRRFALGDLFRDAQDGRHNLLAFKRAFAHREHDRFEDVFHADHVEEAGVEIAHVPGGEEPRFDLAELDDVDDAMTVVALDFGHQVEDRLLRAFEILKKDRPRAVEVQVSCNLQAAVFFARFSASV